MTTELAIREATQEKILTKEERLAQLVQRVNQAHHEVQAGLRRLARLFGRAPATRRADSAWWLTPQFRL